MSRFSPLVVALSLVLGVSLVAGVPATATMTAQTSAGQVSSAAMNAPAAKPGKRKWKAPNGPYFNDPHVKKGHFTIEGKVIETIRHARPKSIIRIAVYSLDRIPVANALVAAKKRGVRVQVLINDHQDTRAMQIVRAAVGTNRNKKSFIYKCVASCRSTQNEFNNLHSKYYSFTKVGKTRNLMAIGSANMTLNAALHQWNDLYFTAGDRELFRQFTSLFNNMKKDWDKRRPPRFFCGTPTGAACDDSVDKYTVWALPKLSGPKNDLVLDMLNRIQCVTTDAAGNPVRAPSWPSRCTPCGGAAATTSPPRSATSSPRAATSGSATGSSATARSRSWARPPRAAGSRSARPAWTTTPRTTSTSTRTARTT